MFENIGKKIKMLAYVFLIGGIIVSFGWAANAVIVLSALDAAVLIFFGGIIATWISSCFVYGFGELIERTANMDEKLTVCEFACDQFLSEQEDND